MRLLVKNGRLIDPFNRIDAMLNIVVEEGRVAAVTCEEGPVSDQTIDAAGKIVCPGFVDLHFHEDPFNPASGRIDHDITFAALRMGVTSSIGGNCGLNFGDPAEYLDALDRDGAPVNVGLFCGHTYFRNAAGLTDKYAPIDQARLEGMRLAIRKCLGAGCFGLSFGIRYVPGLTRDEMLQLSRLLKESGDKLLTAHVRDDAANIFDSVRELADIARELELPVQNSHIGSMGGYGQMEELLRRIDAMRGQGLDISSDCYPYCAFSTRIGEATYDQGFLDRYQTDYGAIEICDGKYQGRRCTEDIFQELRAQAPETITVCHVMKERDVDLALSHPNVFLASDGLISRGQGHPRAAGTFPRFIANYVRGGRIGLHAAIEKMTAGPAEKLGLKSKGRLSRGADADITIFDLEAIEDRATFTRPLLAPKGIDYVIIGGEIALKDGEIVRDRLGRALRREG